MDHLIKNITIVNADGAVAGRDILVRGGRIAEVGAGLCADAPVFDGTGMHAFYGFCDLHSHLRDPGLTHKEDIASGTRSAAAGGFTLVCCMPNTKPPVDSPEAVRYIIETAAKAGFCEVLPVAAITKGMRGETLTDFAALLAAGAVALSDDGMPVEDDDVILAAMARAREVGARLMLHEEDLKNRGAGVAHAGENAQKAGLPGIGRAIEDAMTARDIFYAQKTGTPLHLCHVSTAGSVELVRRAKKNGVRVTCETGPHYFSLTDAAVLGGDPNAKVNPPLREESDRQAVIAGIKDGTVDAIATDHAPHAADEKAAGFPVAPFGLIGFETAFSLAVTNLVAPGHCGLPDLARLLCEAPRRILGIAGGRIEPGAPADLAICDAGAEFVLRAEDIVSKARNTPFLGVKLRGRVVRTMRGGTITSNKQQATR